MTISSAHFGGPANQRAQEGDLFETEEMSQRSTRATKPAQSGPTEGVRGPNDLIHSSDPLAGVKEASLAKRPVSATRAPVPRGEGVAEKGGGEKATRSRSTNAKGSPGKLQSLLDATAPAKTAPISGRDLAQSSGGCEHVQLRTSDSGSGRPAGTDTDWSRVEKPGVGRLAQFSDAESSHVDYEHSDPEEAAEARGERPITPVKGAQPAENPAETGKLVAESTRRQSTTAQVPEEIARRVGGRSQSVEAAGGDAARGVFEHRSRKRVRSRSRDRRRRRSRSSSTSSTGSNSSREGRRGRRRRGSSSRSRRGDSTLAEMFSQMQRQMAVLAGQLAKSRSSARSPSASVMVDDEVQAPVEEVPINRGWPGRSSGGDQCSGRPFASSEADRRIAAQRDDDRMSAIVASAPPRLDDPAPVTPRRRAEERLGRRRRVADKSSQPVAQLSDLLASAISRSAESAEQRPLTFGGDNSVPYSKFRQDFRTKAKRYDWPFTKYMARLYEALDSRVLGLVENKLLRIKEHHGEATLWQIMDDQFQMQDGGLSKSRAWMALTMTSPTQPIDQFLLDFEVAAHQQHIGSEAAKVQALCQKVHPALLPWFIATCGSDMRTAKSALGRAQESYKALNGTAHVGSSLVAAVQPTDPEAKPRACYECASTEHLARDCPNRRGCHRCGGRGHLASKCRVQFPFCPWCAEEGHQPHECPKRKGGHKPHLKYSKSKAGHKKQGKVVAVVSDKAKPTSGQPAKKKLKAVAEVEADSTDDQPAEQAGAGFQ